jgi:hypothetical protein
MAGQSHSVMEAGVAQSSSRTARARIQLEAACHHQSRLIDMPEAVGKHLVQWPEANLAGASVASVLDHFSVTG